MTCVCKFNSRLYLCHRIYSTAIPLLQPSRLHKSAFSGRCRHLRYSALLTHASRPVTTLSNRLVGYNCHTTVRSVSVSTCNKVEGEDTTMAGIRLSLSIIYKMEHNLILVIDIPLDHYIQHNTRSSRKHDSQFLQIRHSANIFGNSFFPTTIKEWNSLPPNTVSSKSLNSFKKNNPTF